MKKTIMILIAVAFCSITYAQSQPETTVSLTESPLLNGKVIWGIKAGWNYSNLYGTEIDHMFASKKTEYQSGFHTGIFVDTRISEHFGLKHELMFSQRRIGVSLFDTEIGAYRSKFTMSYVDFIPANLTYRAGGLQLYGGPYVSTLFAANLKQMDENGRVFNNKNIFGTPDNDETETRYLQKFDFGVNVGLAYCFDFGISIDARYTHGLNDIFQYANSYANEDTKTDKTRIYNKGFMVSIEYVFK